MMLKNAIKIGHEKKFSRYCTYGIFDIEDYAADQLFIDHGVVVKFGQELKSDASPYRFILCAIKKRDEADFLDALSELPNKMLILGYKDYEAFCEKYIGLLAQHGEECR